MTVKEKRKPVEFIIHILVLFLFIIAAVPVSADENEDVEVYHESTEMAYALKLSELVENEDNYITHSNSNCCYESCRLIVKSESRPDFESLDGVCYILDDSDSRYIVQFETSSQTSTAAVKLRGTDGILYVEPDVKISVSSSSTSSALSLSWGDSYIGTDNYAKYTASKTSASITVAVVDSGVDTANSFLKGRLIAGYDFVGNDSNPMDVNGHGTMVSGVIVDNTSGLNVKILPVRVLNKNGEGYYSVIASGIRYAANHGAKVINLSLGGSHSSEIEEALSYAIGKKGAVCVVAAGNDGRSIEATAECPAHIASAITVGSIDSNGHRSDFSDYGDALDLMAPGEGIRVINMGGGHSVEDGTSFSAPHVSACAAMLRLLFPSLTPSQVEAKLKSSCDGYTGTETKYYGAGIVNMNNLLPKGDECSHTMTYTKKVKATCTTDGHKAYYYCSKCKKYFSDSNGLSEISLSSLTIKASGHDYSETQLVSKAGINKKGKYKVLCSRCGSVQKYVKIKAIESVTLSDTKFVYTGKSVKPSVKVTDSAGNIIGKSNYSLSYSNNVNVGTAEVKITFKGNYSGSVSRKFTIKSVSLDYCRLETATYEYTGKHPSFNISLNGKELVQGVDYTVKYSSKNVSVGEHTAVVKGVGNITGQKTVKYTITPTVPKIKSFAIGNSSIKIIWLTAESNTGYEVQYSYKYSMRSAQTISIDRNINKTFIKNINHGMNIYIRIRSYQLKNNEKIYSSWSKIQCVYFY